MINQGNALPTGRQEKVANHLKELAAQFLGRENNRTSLITVTSASCSPDLKRATILIAVLPTSKEKDALNFIKRQLGELREFLKRNIRRFDSAPGLKKSISFDFLPVRKAKSFLRVKASER